jgi:NAD dependent epimerase/dehydratase
MDISNKKVLVTGADGFIGSHLVEMLIKKGAIVRALSYYNSFNNIGWLEDISCLSDLEVVQGDIRDSFFIKRITNDIDVIFHLAALIAIPYSYVAPMSYIDTNVKGTLNICEAALQSGCKKVIHTSTSEVYGTAKYVPINEEHPLQPQSPYSASKTGADQLALSYFYSYGLPVTIARPFNTYGPRQSARAVIPSVIIQIANKNAQIEVGDTTPTRDFSYVEDTCKGFISLAESEFTSGKVINIGSDSEISISDTISVIQKIMGTDISIKPVAERLRPGASEVRRLWCDNTKIKNLCGFEPEYSLENGLRKTVEWFCDVKNLAKYKSHGYIL